MMQPVGDLLGFMCMPATWLVCVMAPSVLGKQGHITPFGTGVYTHQLL